MIKEAVSKEKYTGRGNVDLKKREVDAYVIRPGDYKEYEPNENYPYMLIPKVRDGLDRDMTKDEAWAWYRKTGQHLGKFKTKAEAEKYADIVHVVSYALYKLGKYKK